MQGVKPFLGCCGNVVYGDTNLFALVYLQILFSFPPRMFFIHFFLSSRLLILSQVKPVQKFSGKTEKQS